MAKSKSKNRDDDDDRPKRTEPVKRDGAYLMMLFITLAAMITGCVLLHLDNEEYGKTPPPKETAPAARALGAPLPAEAAAPVVPPPAPPGMP